MLKKAKLKYTFQYLAKELGIPSTAEITAVVPDYERGLLEIYIASSQYSHPEIIEGYSGLQTPDVPEGQQIPEQMIMKVLSDV
jgi:hypothetical protein